MNGTFTHLDVRIKLPLKFNKKGRAKVGKLIPQGDFLKTHQELLKMVGGITTSSDKSQGSWIHPKTLKLYNDETIEFSVVINTENINLAIETPRKLKKLIGYKKKLLKRFKQNEMYMVAIPCRWL